MPKSFIKIKPVTGQSEAHNSRDISPKYLITPSNENINISDSSISQRRAQIEELYLKSVGQKMQKKATPIREAVILLPDDNNEKNLANLFALSDELESRYGIRTFQWHIHNDEGHIDQENQPKYNYHAHLVFDWTDKHTGKSLKLNKQDMSEIQTLTAQVLKMDRGEKGSKNLSLNHHLFRGFLAIKDKLERDLKRKLQEEEEKKLREKIKQDYENKRTNRTGIRRK